MKQCRECGTLSPDATIFCYICGTKFKDFYEEYASDSKTNKLLPEEQKSADGYPEAKVGEAVTGDLLFDGIYQCRYQDCSSFLRFFTDGKVVEVSSTGTPDQVIRWLSHDYESSGFYTIESGIVKFEITDSSGRVSYSGRILKEVIEIDVISHINGYSANNLRYVFHNLT